MQKLKIGFFGGSFNPPINTHIQLAKNLLKDKIVDKIIFVPVGDYYQKLYLESAEHRYNMLKVLCEDCDNIDVEDIAVLSKKKLYAIDTFKIIYNKYGKNADLFFVMGSDNFEKMPTWKNYNEMKDKYNYVVIERPKYKQDCNLPNVTYYSNNNTEDITATKIRNMIKNNEDISNYINDKVFEYIKENKLYLY